LQQQKKQQNWKILEKAKEELAVHQVNQKITEKEELARAERMAMELEEKRNQREMEIKVQRE
jgi:hypothetical protein